MRRYTIDGLARLVDHTNLHPDAMHEDMREPCDQARRYHFRMIAVNSVQSRFCSELLARTDAHTGAAIGFPLGQISVAVKVFETKDALANGVNEIDCVVNLARVTVDGEYARDEMEQIVSVCRVAVVPSKVIFESCLLTQDQKTGPCEVANEVLPSFIKTSTGFSAGGAAVEDVRLTRAHADAHVKVKAAGGIRTADTFLDMVRTGAERIGSSAGAPIVEELTARMEVEGVDSYEL